MYPILARTEISTALKTPLGELRIVTATAAALPWIEHLQRKMHRMIGFVPLPAQQQRAAANDYWLLTLNGDDAGFLLLGAGIRQPVRISQIAVHPDLWNAGIGTAATTTVRRHAATMPCSTVIADVASDLHQMQQMCITTGGKHVSTRLYLSLRRRRTLRFLWPPDLGIRPRRTLSLGFPPGKLGSAVPLRGGPPQPGSPVGDSPALLPRGGRSAEGATPATSARPPRGAGTSE